MADRDIVELSDEFDRLLRDELSIEPSPAFATRVRARVGDDARRSQWWRASWIPAIGSFATVASIAWALLVPAITRVASPPDPPQSPTVRIPAVQYPTISPVVEPQPRVDNARTAGSGSVLNAGRSGVAEVIVDARQRDALSTLFKMMNQGRVSGDSFAATIPVSIEPIAEQMGVITVAPVVLSAMPAGGVLHNER